MSISRRTTAREEISDRPTPRLIAVIVLMRSEGPRTRTRQRRYHREGDDDDDVDDVVLNGGGISADGAGIDEAAAEAGKGLASRARVTMHQAAVRPASTTASESPS
jgi:hypothetical protein